MDIHGEMAVYIPRQGDIITITFDPEAGHEQKGRRPALVVSKDLFNKSTGLAIVCPLTNTERASDELLAKVLSILDACIY